MSLLMPSRPIVINPDLAHHRPDEAIQRGSRRAWLTGATEGWSVTAYAGSTTRQIGAGAIPVWSESTLKRTFTRLKSLGVQSNAANKSQRDVTNY
jgi:hypothetical protein